MCKDSASVGMCSMCGVLCSPVPHQEVCHRHPRAADADTVSNGRHRRTRDSRRKKAQVLDRSGGARRVRMYPAGTNRKELWSQVGDPMAGGGPPQMDWMLLTTGNASRHRKRRCTKASGGALPGAAVPAYCDAEARCGRDRVEGGKAQAGHIRHAGRRSTCACRVRIPRDASDQQGI